MISRTVTQVVIAAVLAAVIFGAGWTTRGWRDASAREGALRQQAKVQAQDDIRRQGVAQAYTERLTLIETNYAALPDWWVWFVAERADLRDLDIGPVGLCIWTAWNAAASAESCTVSESAIDLAAPAQRTTGGSDGKP